MSYLSIHNLSYFVRIIAMLRSRRLLIGMVKKFNHSKLTPPQFKSMTSINTNIFRYASAPASQNLSKVLQKEIDDEKKLEKKKVPALPNGWTINHVPGNGYFTMLKPESGLSPQMEVFCALPKTQQDTNEEPVDQHPFILRMCRNNRTVEYSMVSVENELVVDNIIIYSEIRKIEDFLNATASRKLEARYQGPTLAHLDEGLISALHEYLEENQINDKFAEFVKEQCEFIEQEEYESWLTELRAFAQ